MSQGMIIGSLKVTIGGLRQITKKTDKDIKYGISMKFNNNEQRIKQTRKIDENWDEEFTFDVTDQVTSAFKLTVYECQQRIKASHSNSDELGKIVLPFEDLRDAGTIDKWFDIYPPRSSQPVGQVHLIFSTKVSQISDFISLFNEKRTDADNQKKLSLSEFQYNIVRIVLLLLPIAKIAKQLLFLFRWRSVPASALALQLFIVIVVFDYIGSAVMAIGGFYFLYKYVAHVKSSSQVQTKKNEDKVTKKKITRMFAGGKGGPDPVAAQEDKNNVFQKMRKVQVVLGKIADKLEPIKDIYDWKKPEQSKLVMVALFIGVVVLWFIPYMLIIRGILLIWGLYMFILFPLYTKFPRFKEKYHVKVLVSVLRSRVKETVPILLDKYRKSKQTAEIVRSSGTETASSAEGQTTTIPVSEVTVAHFEQSPVVHSGPLTKQGAIRKNWQKRHFILQGTRLYYFRSNQPTQPALGFIDLSNAVVLDIENKQIKNQKAHCFDIYDRSIPRHYLVHGDSDQDKKDWMAVLHKVLSPSTGGADGSSFSDNHSIHRQPSRGDLGEDADTQPHRLSGELDATALETLGIVKCGWLHKQGAGRRSWKSRWFVLQKDILYYYMKRPSGPAGGALVAGPNGALAVAGGGKTEEPIDGIPIGECSILCVQGSKRHPYVLDVYRPASHRHYLLGAKDDDDRTAWAKVLKEVKGEVAGGSVPFNSLAEAFALSGINEGEGGSSDSDDDFDTLSSSSPSSRGVHITTSGGAGAGGGGGGSSGSDFGTTPPGTSAGDRSLSSGELVAFDAGQRTFHGQPVSGPLDGDLAGRMEKKKNRYSVAVSQVFRRDAKRNTVAITKNTAAYHQHVLKSGGSYSDYSSASFTSTSTSTSTSTTAAQEKLSLEQVEQLEPPAFEGFLKRQEGRVRKAWKPRYVVISGTTLYIFPSRNKDEVAMDTVRLPVCKAYSLPGAVKGMQFCFDVYRYQLQRHHLFCATSEEERKAWVNALREAQGVDVAYPNTDDEIKTLMSSINSQPLDSSSDLSSRLSQSPASAQSLIDEHHTELVGDDDQVAYDEDVDVGLPVDVDVDLDVEQLDDADLAEDQVEEYQEQEEIEEELEEEAFADNVENGQVAEDEEYYDGEDEGEDEDEQSLSLPAPTNVGDTILNNNNNIYDNDNNNIYNNNDNNDNNDNNTYETERGTLARRETTGAGWQRSGVWRNSSALETGAGHNRLSQTQIVADGLPINRTPASQRLSGTITVERLVAEQPTVSGLLKKLGDNVGIKTWRERYFILDTSELYYFKTANGTQKMIDCIDLTKCTITTLTTSQKKEQFCFDVYLGETRRHYLLAANSAEARDHWVEALQTAVRVGRSRRSATISDRPRSSANISL